MFVCTAKKNVTLILALSSLDGLWDHCIPGTAAVLYALYSSCFYISLHLAMWHTLMTELRFSASLAHSD